MAKRISLLTSFVSIIIAAAATACGNTGATKTEKADGVEWNVSVNETVQFHDALTGVSTDVKYTVADTATINQKLLGIKPENTTLGWTIPGSDGVLWLVAYKRPILSEKVVITEVNSMLSFGGDIQVAFKFPDAEKWATITRENIGKRLAVFVNGHLMSAPQVNSEISSGSCSVIIPADKITEFLPDFNLENIQQ